MNGSQQPLSADEARLLGPESATLLHAAHERLAAALRTLPDKPEETTISTARALWLLAAGERLSAAGAGTATLPALDARRRQRFLDLVQQRLAGVPLAHLTQRQRFMGLEMVAGPEALIPRRETEIVGRAAAALAARIADEHGEALVVDVCTGSGNLAAAIASAEPRASVFASDLSDDAIALARRNVEYLGLEGQVTLRSGDLLAPFDTPDFHGRVHLIVCNPPYISSERVPDMPPEIARHEPRLAFDGGGLGVSILVRLIRDAPRLLRPGGCLAFEVGRGQGPSVLRRMARSGAYTTIDSLPDDDGEVRALVARVAVS